MRTFKLENAKQDADFWSHMHDMQTATIEDHKGLIATAERGAAKGETGRAEAAVCVLMRLHEEFKRRIKTQTIPLCVSKTSSALMLRRNRLSWRNDRANPLCADYPGVAVQVEEPA